METGSFPWCPAPGEEAVGTKWSTGGSPGPQEAPVCCASAGGPEAVRPPLWGAGCPGQGRELGPEGPACPNASVVHS